MSRAHYFRTCWRRRNLTVPDVPGKNIPFPITAPAHDCRSSRSFRPPLWVTAASLTRSSLHCSSLFLFPLHFPRHCFASSVDGTSVSKRPSRQTICDPSFTFRGVSLCIYTCIYVHSHMYMCVYMRADGEKGWSFDLSLCFFFSSFFCR